MIRNNVQLIGTIISPFRKRNCFQGNDFKYQCDIEVEGWKGNPERFFLTIYKLNKNIHIDLSCDYTGRAFILNGFLSGDIYKGDNDIPFNILEVIPREMQIVSDGNIAQSQKGKDWKDEIPF